MKKEKKEIRDLKGIWHDQWKFNENFININKMDLTAKQEQTKEYILLLQGEIHEVLREINYKKHRVEPIDLKTGNIKEEIIDVFKYWMSLAQLWFDHPEEIIQEYIRKSSVVEQRYKQEFQLDLMKEKKVIGVDIDGVLADYPKCFQDFILEKTGVWIDLQGYDLYGEYAAVLGRGVAENLKKEFRESGQKRYIPVIPEAKDFLHRYHKKGYKIVLLTSRPYKEHKRIFADTIYWLNKNELVHDAIIWDEEKNYKAIQQFPNMEFMVEDNGKFALNIAELGYPVYLIDKSYNQQVEHDNIIRIKGLNEI